MQLAQSPLDSLLMAANVLESSGPKLHHAFTRSLYGHILLPRTNPAVISAA
jgi:hypothetical protein